MTESDYQYRQAYERYLATQRRIMSSYSESISLPPSSRPAPLEPNGSSTHPLLHLGIGATPRATPLTPSATDHIIRCGTVNVKEDGLSAWLWKTKWIVLREQTISIHKSESSLPQVTIFLRDVSSIERSDLKAYCLLLEVKDNRYYISLKDDDELYGWQDDVYARTPLGASCSSPMNFVHHIHVAVDPGTGALTGLPDRWEKLLTKSNITMADYATEAVLNVLESYSDYNIREVGDLRASPHFDRGTSLGGPNLGTHESSSSVPNAAFELVNDLTEPPVPKLRSLLSRSQSSEFWIPHVTPDNHIYYLNGHTEQQSRDPHLPPTPPRAPHISNRSSSTSVEVSGLGTTAENEVPYHHADTHPIYVQEFEVSVSDEHFSDLESSKVSGTSSPEENISLPSLLGILRSKTARAHELKLDLMYKLLDFPDYGVISEVKDPLDAEMLLEFILYLLHNKSLADSNIQDANRKLRKLMFKLISMTDVLPRSLFITDIITLDVIGMGGFGRVFKGKYKRQHVALKVVDKSHKSRSLRKDFCREALIWRSLQHRFIIPLLGIYEEKSLLYLVSPFMTNGTLTQWRKNHPPIVPEIHRLMLEAAEGMHYIQSEGIVHGDLHGGNILLDSEFHCQITDFGLTRHSEATTTQSTVAVAYHFAAPELFGLCLSCKQPGCYGCGGSSRRKTVQTDVYAFGCLYYAIFFDSVPFEKANNLLIMRLVTDGIRPEQLKSPEMENKTWNLISNCWKTNPSERPTMEQIVELLSI